MTTNADIKELAQRLREAAKTSLSAPEFGSSDVAGITRLRLMKPFADLARPKNILALLDALEAAQKRIAELEASQPVVPEWISVSDRLPENETLVLTIDKNSFINTAVFVHGDGYSFLCSFNLRQIPSVTHWMPTPAAPALQEE